MAIFKNIVVFYVLLFIPWLPVIFLKPLPVSSSVFVTLLFVYLFVYRTILCNLRLIANKRISKKEIWLNFIPFRLEKYDWFLFYNMEDPNKRNLNKSR